MNLPIFIFDKLKKEVSKVFSCKICKVQWEKGGKSVGDDFGSRVP